MNFYVYEWFIVETNEIFYVGKGCRNRYKVKKHNNVFNYILKHNKCESRIIKFFDEEKDAFEYEYFRVKELKQKGQCKANIYQGGLGGTISWWDEKNKEKYSKYNVMKSEEQRKRMSESNPMKNIEVKKKVIEKNSKKIIIGDKIYNSIKEASLEYQVYDTAIQYWLKRGYSKDLKECYYLGEKPKEIVFKNHITNTKPVIVDDIYFSTVKEASKYINVSEESLIRAMKKNRNCKGHTCKYANQQPSYKNSDKSIVEGSTTNE